MLESRQQLPPSAAQMLAELIPSVDAENKARFLIISSFTMMVYEYCLTLDDEVRNFHNYSRNSLTFPSRLRTSGRGNGP